ncbi:hypothetical protein HMPREF0663_10815 [Hoylesella oralis ATCC 33269]|uniref:Uncharacterized protein n=1 Tax=Hoylesella oralis ATCC 33269 TaxID=873533 RepID=E7RNR4_9BACT|nr:hypothetical protein HMPREF0663_10815 [Hoylesella oralis ATCC 33269]
MDVFTSFGSFMAYPVFYGPLSLKSQRAILRLLHLFLKSAVIIVKVTEI